MTRTGLTYFIGIAGASCSGKTTLARGLVSALADGGAALLALDRYYHDLSHLGPEAHATWNFDAPEALEHAGIVRDLAALARGETIHVPHYDYATHARSVEREALAPAPFVIVEGLFALYWQDLREMLGTRVFAELDDDACFARRRSRDTRERGIPIESVTLQYENTVRPMYEQYCRPTAQYADLVVRGDAPIEESVAAILRLVRRA